MIKKRIIVTVFLAIAIAAYYFSIDMSDAQHNANAPTAMSSHTSELGAAQPPSEETVQSADTPKKHTATESQLASLTKEEKLFFPWLLNNGEIDQAIYDAWYKNPDNIHINSLILRRCINEPTSDFCALPLSESFIRAAEEDAFYTTLIAIKALKQGNLSSFEQAVSQLESLDWNSEHQRALHQEQLSILSPNGVITATTASTLSGEQLINLAFAYQCITVDIVDCSGIYQSMESAPKGSWMHNQAAGISEFINQNSNSMLNATNVDSFEETHQSSTSLFDSYGGHLLLLQSNNCVEPNDEIPQAVLEGILGYGGEQQQAAEQWFSSFPESCFGS